MKKFLLLIITLFLVSLQAFSKTNEFKNILHDLNVSKISDSSFKVILKTEVPYTDEIKIVKKSDNSYYILLAETYTMVKSGTGDGAIKEIKINTYPYTEQDFENGYTKISVFTTKPVDFSVNLTSKRASKFPIMDLVRLARLEELYKKDNFDYINSKAKVTTANVENLLPKTTKTVTSSKKTELVNENKTNEAQNKNLVKQSVYQQTASKQNIVSKSQNTVKQTINEIQKTVLPVFSENKKQDKIANNQKVVKNTSRVDLNLPSKNVKKQPDKVLDTNEKKDTKVASNNKTSDLKLNNENKKDDIKTVKKEIKQQKDVKEEKTADDNKKSFKDKCKLPLAIFFILLIIIEIFRRVNNNAGYKKINLSDNASDGENSVSDGLDNIEKESEDINTFESIISEEELLNGTQNNSEVSGALITEESENGTFEGNTGDTYENIEEQKGNLNEEQEEAKEIIETSDETEIVKPEVQSAQEEIEQVEEVYEPIFVPEENNSIEITDSTLNEEQAENTTENDIQEEQNSIQDLVQEEQAENADINISDETNINMAETISNGVNNSIPEEQRNEERIEHEKSPVIVIEKPKPKPPKPKAKIIYQAEISNDRGLYLTQYLGNKALIGYIDDDIFVLYNFGKMPIKTNEVIFRLSESRVKEELYFVMVDNMKFLIKTDRNSMELIKKIA